MSVWPAVALICCVGCGRLGFDPEAIGDDELGPDGGVAGQDPIPPPPLPGELGQITYRAAIAECINPRSPDLAWCVSLNGNAQLVVDGNDGTTDEPWESYVRFDIPQQSLSGRKVTGAKLVMTATDDDKADGPDSGEIWKVTPFDRTSLANGAPNQTSRLATTRGSVDRGERVEWPLPLNILGAAVYLGVITTSQSGGVNYWNLAGVSPPLLVLDVE